MIEPRSGLIIRYSYLWARERDRGEESGRKDRPACVQVLVVKGGREQAVLLPITSQPPRGERATLEIPQIEARRAGLSVPAWIVVDEWNEDDLATSAFIADTNPLGSFSRAFTLKIREAAAGAIRARKHRRISR